MEKNETVLVTGGTGFVGSHVIFQLLEKGYHVKTTIRNLDRKKAALEMLSNGGTIAFDRLTFVSADLTRDDHWEEAVKNCEYVLHVASPFPGKEPRDPDELIVPAREGTLRVLRASAAAGVKRVVMTSSFAAIGYSINPKNHLFTESDWTDPEAKISSYVKSKTLAELAAWDFIKKAGGGMELTVINPVGIFGPVLWRELSSSVKLIEQLMSGKMKATPKLSFGMVDVRDVADIHLKAMTHPKAKGERFLATADTTSLPEIAGILHSLENPFAKNVTTRVLPDWVVRMAAIFKPDLRSVAAQLGKNKTISNEKAKTTLGWQPLKKEITLMDTALSLIKSGIIR